MLCLNRKPHSTLFICFLSLLSPLGRGIINAVILCIFNSITSALPLEVDVSVIGAHHVGALFILLLYVIVKVSRLLLECSWLIKRNCFILRNLHTKYYGGHVSRCRVIRLPYSLFKRSQLCAAPKLWRASINTLQL